MSHFVRHLGVLKIPASCYGLHSSSFKYLKWQCILYLDSRSRFRDVLSLGTPSLYSVSVSMYRQQLLYSRRSICGIWSVCAGGYWYTNQHEIVKIPIYFTVKLLVWILNFPTKLLTNLLTKKNPKNVRIGISQLEKINK